jgi:hypothetical protein
MLYRYHPILLLYSVILLLHCIVCIHYTLYLYIFNHCNDLALTGSLIGNKHICLFVYKQWSGADPGGAHPARAPPKIGKIWFFGVKSWFFTRNTPKIFAPPSAIGKNMIFCRKIVIFHTKYPKIFRTSLRSARFF